jgi:hypothetical protein
MNSEPASSIDDHQKHSTVASDARLRRWVTWIGVSGTGVLGVFFFGFMAFQTVWGAAEPTNWVVKLTKDHYAAVVGTPMSAVTAFCIVSLLKVTSGPIEFEAFGLKFHGASGPIILWIISFLSVIAAFHLLWPDLAVPRQ